MGRKDASTLYLADFESWIQFTPLLTLKLALLDKLSGDMLKTDHFIIKQSVGKFRLDEKAKFIQYRSARHAVRPR